MEIIRKRARIIVDINVTVTTVLDSLEARIIDLSEQGAQIVGASLPTGAKFQIEYLGQTVYAQCQWSEVDRMGVRFPFPLSDGPLYDALMMAMPGDGSAAVDARSAAFMPPASLVGVAKRGASTFGRRG